VIDNAYPQAAFDPRILNLPLIGNLTTLAPGSFIPLVQSALRRGYIKQDRSLFSGANAPVYACAFLYNPSLVEVTHGIDASAASLTLPQYQRNPDDSSTYLVGMAAACNFSLLFDRTYEINSGLPQGPGAQQPYPDNIPQGNGGTVQEDPRRIGVLADVQALYRICGIQGQQVTQKWTDANNNPQSSVLSGTMMQVPARVHFGGQANGGSISYYGYISSLDIQYTQFSMSMIPMRCRVDVTFTLLPDVS
jgi:hypothetical protein